jgi:hypothetical protein
MLHEDVDEEVDHGVDDRALGGNLALRVERVPAVLHHDQLMGHSRRPEVPSGETIWSLFE